MRITAMCKLNWNKNVQKCTDFMFVIEISFDSSFRRINAGIGQNF